MDFFMDKLVVFTLDNQQYGMNSYYIKRIIRAVEVTPLPYFPSYFLGIINIHGEAVPVINIRHWLGLPSLPIDICHYFIISSLGEYVVTFVIDNILDVINYDPADIAMQDKEKQTEICHQILKMPDGFIVLLNPDRLLREEDKKFLFHEITEKII